MKFSNVKEMEFLRTLSQKNANISAQSVRILDLKSVLETLINPTKNIRTRKWDLTARYLPKEALKLTDAEKTQTFENFVRGRSRQDLTETCLGHLVWDTWDHPWTIPDLGFLWQFCSTHDGFKRTVSDTQRRSLFHGYTS